MMGLDEGERFSDVARTTISVSSKLPEKPSEGAGEPAAPLRRIDRFIVLRELGSGAMGTVYAAYDEQLNRKVALKVVHPMGQRAQDVRTRMLREAQGLARLSHPNVVQVYEAKEDAEGRVYLVMEFIEGKTLRAWGHGSEYPWRVILGRCIDAGRGLAAAHRAGLVHRDFKPNSLACRGVCPQSSLGPRSRRDRPTARVRASQRSTPQLGAHLGSVIGTSRERGTAASPLAPRDSLYAHSRPQSHGSPGAARPRTR